MRSVLFLVVVCLSGCSEEVSVPFQMVDDDGRLEGDVVADGSCGCPSGLSLVCATPGGDMVPASSWCEIDASGDAIQFSLRIEESLLEACGQDDPMLSASERAARSVDSLICI